MARQTPWCAGALPWSAQLSKRTTASYQTMPEAVLRTLHMPGAIPPRPRFMRPCSSRGCETGMLPGGFGAIRAVWDQLRRRGPPSERKVQATVATTHEP